MHVDRLGQAVARRLILSSAEGAVGAFGQLGRDSHSPIGATKPDVTRPRLSFEEIGDGVAGEIRLRCHEHAVAFCDSLDGDRRRGVGLAGSRGPRDHGDWRGGSEPHRQLLALVGGEGARHGARFRAATAARTPGGDLREGSAFERPGRPIHERRTVVEPGEVAGQEETGAGGNGRNGACRRRFGDGVEYQGAVQAERPSGLSDPRHHLGMPGEGTGHRAARQRPEDPLHTFFERGGRLV